MIERRRHPVARIGITLLNLLAPGLGLLRVGDLRRALLAYGASTGALAVFVAVLVATTNISFRAYAILLGTGLFVALASYGAAIWWTWRASRVLTQPRPIWSRWYSVVGAMLIAFGISWILTGIWESRYRHFYLPSEGMEPTLSKSDRFLASMRKPTKLRRGDIILVRSPYGNIYVKRLAALPGDQIALRRGAVVINGMRAEVRPAGVRAVSYPYRETTIARVFEEKFPRESKAHIIQDFGASEADDVPEAVVRPGHVFVLGDNRDHSADSRVPHSMGGLEQVPVENVIGRALFVYWPLQKAGTRLHEGRLE